MSDAVVVRKGRVAALLTASLVTVTAVVGALTGAGSTAPASAAPRDVAEKHERAAASLTSAVVEPERLAVSPEQARAGRPLALPEDSGSGRRVVFDESEQHVWLVREDGSVARDYPVSGSVHDNLDPGTYQVYSKDEQAWAYDGSGTMRWMVRFTVGENAPIGFHDIPLESGEKAQTRAQLGTATSSGCIRQWPDDAKALYRFAPVGTTVVVTA